MANELELGTRRVGHLYDFSDETPELAVVLENSERGISVTVSWTNEDNPYASWFSNDDGIVRIPPSSTTSSAPRKVIFKDSHGSVMLIGCRARGFHRNVFGPGSGTLWGQAAILGADKDVDFSNPHGLMSDIPGLRKWLGLSSWAETRIYEPGQSKISIASVKHSEIEVGDLNGIRLSMQLDGSLHSENGGDRRIINDYARCVTRSSEEKTWGTHLRLHHALRDLLVLSRWHEESCTEAFALHEGDPIQTLDEKTHGPQWRPVVVPGGAPIAPLAGPEMNLIGYGDIGAEGIMKWVSLREEFQRALDPVISSISLKGTTANTRLAHTGPGLEALGYMLMIRDGISSNSAGRSNLNSRFQRILADLNDCLPFDSAAWVDSTVSAYNGLKHVNRQEPLAVDVMNAWRESVMVVRAWIAIELGIEPQKVKERLSRDPQRLEYVSVG